MSFIKKNDAKNHLAARKHTGIQMIRPTARPVDAGLPSIDQANTEVNEKAFVGDFSAEHCSPGGTVSAVVIATPEEVQGVETTTLPRE